MAETCRSETGAGAGVERGVAEGRTDMAECGGFVSVAAVFFTSLPSEKRAIAGRAGVARGADFTRRASRCAEATERFSEGREVVLGS